MKIGLMLALSLAVALRKESVDRNIGRLLQCCFVILVALRKESVDRNFMIVLVARLMYVALRKESVDRNINTMQIVIVVMESLSARRAWIEMPIPAPLR